MLMQNKKADVAVTLLVFMAIALAAATSFIFLTSTGKIEAKIVDARFIDEIYLTEEQLDFYINDIMEKAVEKTKGSENFKEDFIINFLDELSKYKDKNGNYILDEFIQVGQQIREHEYWNNIKVENGKIIAEFKIKIGAKKEPFNAVYTYNKKFTKEI